MATFQNKLHVSEHSADGKLFAFLNSDGKLKIWNTDTNNLVQEVVPNYHLNAPFTCFTWINVNCSIGTQRKTPDKKSKASAQTEYIALGTRNGGVNLYSFGTGKIEHNLKGDGHQGSVTAICRGDGNNLFTCGDDCRIIVWNLESGSQIASWEAGSEKPTAIVYLPNSNQVAIAGRQLYIWSLENQSLENTFMGHSSHILLLKYVVIKAKEYLLTASKSDRTLTLWRVKPNKNRPQSYAYLMEDIAINASLRFNEDSFEIAAVTRSGVLHLYVVEGLATNIDENSTKPMKPTLSIEIANDSSQLVDPIPVCTASLGVGRAQKTIQIGYGDRQVLRFEMITPDYSDRRQVLTRNAFKSKQADFSDKTRAAQILKNVTPTIDLANVEFQSKDVVARKNKKSVEVPLETRLENLTFDSLTQDKGKQGRNVAQLLIQALHSRDTNLMRMAFTQKDEQVVRATLKRIPPQYIPNLVAELTELAQKKASNSHTAAMWIKALLQTQSSQLMAIGTFELNTMFGPLIGLAERRTNTLQQLTKLSGRLDLLINQIKQNTDEDLIEDSDLLVYEDKDSDDSDAALEESSDEGWDDAEEDDSDEKMES